ncbi:MAG: endonuclease/exonuclease/phosphatase family protein [Ignavibacteria bacterium]|nr:endonuclease/exonuclease/phosphatase family protein [Ignavibacteria bacterium]
MFIRIVFVLSVLLSAADALCQTPIPISEARKQNFLSIVGRVAGRVTASGEFRNTSYIQDKTAGIAIFNSNFRSGVRVGDSVVIDSAQLTEFQATTGAPGTGSTQLSGSTFRFTVIPGARIEPAAKTTTIPLIGESVEGQLVKIRRVKFIETGSFQGETNYNVRDALGNDVAVRVDGGTEIAVNSLPIPTDEVDVIGLVSQFRGGYQLVPRYATDISLPPVEVDTVKKSLTFDVTTWNLNWYGSSDTTKGPKDKNRQRQSIRRVIDSVSSDLFCFQEVTSSEALMALTDSVVGTYATLYPTEITSEQRMAYMYNTATVTKISDGLAVNGGAQAWANGRFPYRLTLSATVDGKTQRITVFNIHAKATDTSTAVVDYNRRKVDAETFHAYLRDFYADSAVIFTGDFNDVLTASVVDSTFSTPYKAFLDDTASWTALTLPMEQRGLASYVGFTRSFLDHVLVSKQLKNRIHRTYLEAPTAYLSSYSSTVTDHLPVTTRIRLDATTGIAEDRILANGNLRVAPNPVYTSATIELTVNKPGKITIQLVDQLGRVIVLSDEYSEPQIKILQLPVATLSNGCYSLHAITPEGTSVVTVQVVK